MTTYQNLIDDTRDHLMTGQPDRVNVLDVTIDDNPATTGINFRHAVEGVKAGTRLAMGLEEMHVLACSGLSATVIRAFNGTSISSHSAGELIRINPQFSDAKIGKAINHCLTSLSSEGLWWVDDVSFTYTPAQYGYDVAMPDYVGIWRVRYNYPGPEQDWPILKPQQYSVDVHPDETDFPSGFAFMLREGGYPGQEVRIAYKRRFSTLTNLTDDVETVAHLPESSHEIPPYGAAFRLLSGRDVKRSFLNRQPEPRRQEEVPPGAATQAMGPLVQNYYSAIDREKTHLHRLYPQQTG